MKKERKIRFELKPRPKVTRNSLAMYECGVIDALSSALQLIQLLQKSQQENENENQTGERALMGFLCEGYTIEKYIRFLESTIVAAKEERDALLSFRNTEE